MENETAAKVSTPMNQSLLTDIRDLIALGPPPSGASGQCRTQQALLGDWTAYSPGYPRKAGGLRQGDCRRAGATIGRELKIKRRRPHEL